MPDFGSGVGRGDMAAGAIGEVAELVDVTMTSSPPEATVKLLELLGAQRARARASPCLLA